MPGGDRTGPMGMGPMTGRAAGFCAGYGISGYTNPIAGRRFLGRGRGHRFWYYATGLPNWARFGGYAQYPCAVPPAYMSQPTSEQELSMLKQQAEYFQQTLSEINERIEALEKEVTKKD